MSKKQKKKNPTHEEFVPGAHGALLAAFNAAEDTSSALNPARIKNTKKNIKKALYTVLYPSDPVKYKNPAAHTRRIAALLNSLERGDVVLRDADDVIMFAYALMADFRQITQVVEYYSETGEFMELVRTIDGDLIDAMSQSMMHPFFGNPHNMGGDYARIQMYRFYCYDMEKITECMKSGENVTDYTSLPLEVRLSLSGALFPPGFDYEEMESTCTYEVNHRDVLGAVAPPETLAGSR